MSLKFSPASVVAMQRKFAGQPPLSPAAQRRAALEFEQRQVVGLEAEVRALREEASRQSAESADRTEAANVAKAVLKFAASHSATEGEMTALEDRVEERRLAFVPSAAVPKFPLFDVCKEILAELRPERLAPPARAARGTREERAIEDAKYRARLKELGLHDPRHGMPSRGAT